MKALLPPMVTDQERMDLGESVNTTCMERMKVHLMRNTRKDRFQWTASCTVPDSVSTAHDY